MAKLHVFTGDAAAETVRTALRIPKGDALVQHDVISCGPARAFESLDGWIRNRDEFWEEVCGGPALESFPDDVVMAGERMANAPKLVLWVGAGLSDRLLLPSVIALCHHQGKLPPIEVMEIASHRSLSVPVLGWGMLRSEDVGSPTAVAVTTELALRSVNGWAAFTAESPQRYLDFLEAVEDDHDLLAALSTLIERYPDTIKGLSHWDAALMAATPDAGADAMTVVRGAIGANHQHLDPVGDLYLFWRLRRMGDPNLKQPLLELSGDLSTMRQCRVVPTPFGRKVRDGNANHVAINGIDDWVGGVHLRSPAGSPWYRRNGTLLPASDL